MSLMRRAAALPEANASFIAAVVPFAVADDTVRTLDLAICPEPGRQSSPR